MKVRYRNDLYGNYMLIEIPETTDTAGYPFKMLMKNKISGVLSCSERKEDGKSYLYVDINQKKNLLSEFQDKELQLEDMISFFQEVTDILEKIRSYLLHEKMAVLDPEYLFRDPESHSLYILVLPWKMENNTLHKLAEFFLEKVNHKDENGVNAAYMFYRQQNQLHFSLFQFMSVLEKESILKRQKIKEIDTIPMPETEIYDMKEEEVLISEKKAQKNVKGIPLGLFFLFLILSVLPMLSPMIKLSCMAFSILCFIAFLYLVILKKIPKPEHEINGEIKQEIEIENQETVFFHSYEEEECLKLQWREKGRKKQVILKEFPCIVGKIKEEVNVVIKDSSVSRVHCKFIEKNNRICIMDLNSTNGTYLNGLPVKDGEIQEIEKNDEILIGKVVINVV